MILVFVISFLIGYFAKQSRSKEHDKELRERDMNLQDLRQEVFTSSFNRLSTKKSLKKASCKLVKHLAGLSKVLLK